MRIPVLQGKTGFLIVPVGVLESRKEINKMIVHSSKHSKRSTVASIVILIVIGLIFFIVTGCAKEEKDEQQDDMINKQTIDTSKTLPPVNVDKSNIIIVMKKEGEIWIEGEKVDLDSIKRRTKND